jgi:hypothetical protein
LSLLVGPQIFPPKPCLCDNEATADEFGWRISKNQLKEQERASVSCSCFIVSAICI